jgi:hypothetical protein
MMEARKDVWYSQPDPDCPRRSTEWAFQSYKAVDDLKVFVANRDEADKFDRWRCLYNRELGTNMDLPDFLDFAKDRMPDNYQTIVEDVQETRKKSWNRYTDNYQEKTRTDWFSKHKVRRKDLEAQLIEPLCEMHVAWCESQRFRAYFNGVFDSIHPGSGLVYTGTMSRCYAGVQDKYICYEHMVKCLSKDLTKDNLLGRAIVLNQASTVQSIRSSSPQGGDYHSLLTFTWEDHITKFRENTIKTITSKKAVTTVAKSGLKASIKILDDLVKADQVPTILTQYLGGILGGPMARVTQSCLKNKSCYNTLVAAGVVAGAPTIPVKMVGDEEAIFKKVSSEIVLWATEGKMEGKLNIDKSKSNVERMVKAAARMTKTKEGVKKFDQIEQEYLINLPEAEKWLKEKKGTAFYKKMPGSAAEELQGIMVTPEELQELNWKTWESVSESTLSKTTTRLKAAAVPALFRTVLGFIQLGDCFQKNEDLAKMGAGSGGKTRAAYIASVAALTATVGDGIEKTLGRIPSSGLRFGAKLTKFQTGTRWLGRTGTVVGGLLTAYVDGCSAWSELKKEEYFWATVYFMSCGLGIAATAVSILGWMVSAEWTALGFASFEAASAFLTALSLWLIAIALLINIVLWFLPDDIEKWLDKCTWGRSWKWNPDGRFPSIILEQNELAALASY